MKFPLVIICACITIKAYSQTPDKALVRVQYSFSHIRDTTQRDKPYTENMLLVAGKNASLYTSYEKIQYRVNTALQLPNISREFSRAEYYFFISENKFLSKENVFVDYLVEEDAPKIDWRILKDTLSFSGINCQKATANFKGRNWIAWFAPELPFQSGPWKLNGLPGLIIEAYDNKKEVQFKFAGIAKIKAGDRAIDNSNSLHESYLKEIPGLDVTEITLPPNLVVISRKDFDKLKAARDKDPQGFIDAQFAAMGRTNPGVKAGNGSGGGGGSSDGTTAGPPPTARATVTPPTQNAINNPIELPEIK